MTESRNRYFRRQGDGEGNISDLVPPPFSPCFLQTELFPQSCWSPSSQCHWAQLRTGDKELSLLTPTGSFCPTGKQVKAKLKQVKNCPRFCSLCTDKLWPETHKRRKGKGLSFLHSII